MNKTTKILLAAAWAIMTSGVALAGEGPSYICAYVNDNVDGPNYAEGYKVGPGDATVRVGPYSTNGDGRGGGFYAGGLGATRLREGDLYVSDGASDNITHFTINKKNCTLTLDNTLYPSGDTSPSNLGDGLAIAPDGNTMFVGSTGDGHIYSHAIHNNGSLGPTFTEASGSDAPVGIEVSPDGKTLVVNYYIGQVCAYPISSGHLGTPNCQPTAGVPTGVSIDPAGACVYAAESNGGTAEIVAFTLTGGVLGAPTEYNHFGPGSNSNGILANWDNETIYVSDAYSSQLSRGSIASGCKLTYQDTIADGVADSDQPGQIAQAKIAHGYVVTGDYNAAGTPSMGVFRADENGKLTPLDSGQFPLMKGGVPVTVVVVGVK
jgi:6-phosphogluconolactonase (cycloisomerase 2 family)